MDGQIYCNHTCEKCKAAHEMMVRIECNRHHEQGWVCPTCKRVFAPFVAGCTMCSRKAEKQDVK